MNGLLKLALNLWVSLGLPNCARIHVGSKLHKWCCCLRSRDGLVQHHGLWIRAMREGKVKAAIRGEAAVAIVCLPPATHQDEVRSSSGRYTCATNDYLRRV